MAGGIQKFRIQVSEDRLAVLLDCTLPEEGFSPVAARIYNELSSLSISDSPSREQLTKLLQAAAANGPLVKGLVLKRGEKPVPPRHSEIKWASDFFGGADPEAALRGGYEERAARRAVKKDQFLCRVAKAKDGKDGRDVFGRPISVDKARREQVEAGPNVRSQEAGEAQLFFAAADGRIRWASYVVAVDQVDTLEGGAGPDSGELSYPGAVHIKGDVLSGARITAGGDVEISGTVEPAEITAGGDLIMEGGITCSDFGMIKIAGRVRAKFVQSANIEAGESVVIEGDVLNSKLNTRGSLRAGRIVGGRVVALGGIVAEQAGSVGLARTDLVAAEDYLYGKQVSEKRGEVSKLEEELAKNKATLELLMSRQRTLTPKMREETTILFVEQAEMEGAIEKLSAEIESLEDLSRIRAVPTILIKSKIHPGTCFRIGGLEQHVKELTRGPIRAFLRYEKVVLVPDKG